MLPTPQSVMAFVAMPPPPPAATATAAATGGAARRSRSQVVESVGRADRGAQGNQA
jgi:hypothetical protein